MLYFNYDEVHIHLMAKAYRNITYDQKCSAYTDRSIVEARIAGYGQLVPYQVHYTVQRDCRPNLNEQAYIASFTFITELLSRLRMIRKIEIYHDIEKMRL